MAVIFHLMRNLHRERHEQRDKILLQDYAATAFRFKQQILFHFDVTDYRVCRVRAPRNQVGLA